LNILVAGGFDADNSDQEERHRAFCEALGLAIITHGHVLLTGARTQLDKLVAEAANEALADVTDEAERENRIVSYILAGEAPIHSCGTCLRSRLTNWDIASETFYIPEQVRLADAVVLVGGFEGTLRAANWARFAGKPLLPFTGFGGAAEKVYDQELNDFDAKYAVRVDRLEYEQLNSVIASNWDAHATTIVALAEKIATSRSVLVVMSYASRADLVDLYDSIEQVVESLSYNCSRVTEATAGERILPEILDRISEAAFVVVDLTELRPNVFYELGFADGLGQKVIVTAKLGTELPFDVKDIPTIFWDSQKKLREDLLMRIHHVVKTAIPAAGAPINSGRIR